MRRAAARRRSARSVPLGDLSVAGGGAAPDVLYGLATDTMIGCEPECCRLRSTVLPSHLRDGRDNLVAGRACRAHEGPGKQRASARFGAHFASHKRRQPAGGGARWGGGSATRIRRNHQIEVTGEIEVGMPGTPSRRGDRSAPLAATGGAREARGDFVPSTVYERPRAGGGATHPSRHCA
jgi:hypothetical protein